MIPSCQLASPHVQKLGSKALNMKRQGSCNGGKQRAPTVEQSVELVGDHAGPNNDQNQPPLRPVANYRLNSLMAQQMVSNWGNFPMGTSWTVARHRPFSSLRDHGQGIGDVPT